MDCWHNLGTWSHQGYWRPPRAPPPRPYGKNFQRLTQNRVAGRRLCSWRLGRQNIQITCRKLIIRWYGRQLLLEPVVKRANTLWSMDPLAKAYYLDAIVMRHISLNQATPAVGMQKKERGACFWALHYWSPSIPHLCTWVAFVCTHFAMQNM